MAENFEQTLAHVNTNSKPSDLRITDMRFVDIVGAPMHCTLLRIETNQGITGYGEVRDGASKLYAQMLKRLLIAVKIVGIANYHATLLHQSCHLRLRKLRLQVRVMSKDPRPFITSVFFYHCIALTPDKSILLPANN